MGGVTSAAHLPDVLYVVRPGDDNDELRHSLRSVEANVPHRKVWVAGHCPWWVKNVEAIELPPLEDRFDNQHQSLTAAVNHPDLADEFYYFNDDIYAVERFDGLLPALHLGPLADYIDWLRAIGKRHTSEWLAGMVEMLDLLRAQGVNDPLCYENHAPHRFRKADMQRFVQMRTRHFLPAQFYPLSGLPDGTRAVDAKSGKLGDPLAAQMPFLSSDDSDWEHSRIGEFVREMFPTPCFYEGAPARIGV